MPPHRVASKATTISLVLSYAFDWVVLGALGGVGFYLGNKEPNKRPFSLTNPQISFPHKLQETVPAGLASGLNTGIPIVVILVVCLTLVPGPGSAVPRGTPRAVVWRRRLWEWHQGWLGLGLSVAGAWFITNALKNMFGRPRPDLLARCQPDLSDVARYVVGGLPDLIAAGGGDGGSLAGGQLVSADICRNPDASVLDDGFRSFPSGHSSSSAAGLVYLTLFLLAKLGIALPFLHHAPFNPAAPSASSWSSSSGAGRPRRSDDEELAASADSDVEAGDHTPPANVPIFSARQQSASPPLFLLVLALVPTALAVFIASSRFFDFRHHATDILAGFIIGVATAYPAFRYYHLPVARGGGWAWAPRRRAWWGAVGTEGWAGAWTTPSRLRQQEKQHQRPNEGKDQGAASIAATGDEENGGDPGRRGRGRGRRDDDDAGGSGEERGVSMDVLQSHRGQGADDGRPLTSSSTGQRGN